MERNVVMIAVKRKQPHVHVLGMKIVLVEKIVVMEHVNQKQVPVQAVPK